MSLNGLDNAKVREAHEAAVAEPGGWFLLKYCSRDEVELMERGTGGIVEVRNTITQYEENSPLFGFLRYRRRNVVIKYVPEACSRLVQARVTVHFNAVAERFSPFDTVFPIVSSKELKDSALSAACSLHTASGSTSSSTSSLRRRRLMEIAEDAEEDNRAKRQSTVPEERPPTARAQETLVGSLSASSAAMEQATTGGLPYTDSHQSICLDRSTSPPPPLIHHTLNDTASTDLLDGRRRSIQSTKPELASLSSYGSSGRTKVKLGPRPSLDVGGRTHTSITQFRPVSTLPIGIKMSSKSAKKAEEIGRSSYQAGAPSLTLSPPPISDSGMYVNSLRPHTSNGRPNTSSGSSFRALPSPTTIGSRAAHITPEKARLMKALELRKRREQQAINTGQTISGFGDVGFHASSDTKEEASSTMLNEAPDSLIMLDDLAKIDDSGIAFETRSTNKTERPDVTQPDSCPASPVCLSENAESKGASSFSESMNETIHIANPFNPLPAIMTMAHINPHCGNPPLGQSLEQPQVENPLLHYLLPVAYEPTERPVPITSLSKEENQTVYDKHKHDHVDIVDEKSSIETVHVPQATSAMLASLPGPQLSQVVDTPVKNPVSTTYQSELTDRWEVPQSKFSVQSLAVAHTIGTPPPSTQPIEACPEPETDRSLDNHIHSNVTKMSTVDMPKSKRRLHMKPIFTDLDLTDRSSGTSAANLSSDDEFMDELQSAVVQEAKPVPFSKSPISPVFPSPKKNGNRFSRAFSGPLHKDVPANKLPDPSESAYYESSRAASASAAYLNRANQPLPKPVAKKVNLGSGISQRIKALEKLSSNGVAANDATVPIIKSTTVSPAFFSVNNSRVHQTSRSPSIAERTTYLNRNTPSPSNSREPSPETVKVRHRSSSIQSRVESFKPISTPSVQVNRTRPESISVTARIVRDPAQLFPSRPDPGKDPLNYKPIEFKQSLLIIDHQEAVQSSSNEGNEKRRFSEEQLLSETPKRERRSSITIIKDIISETRTSFSERRRSMNIEPSLVKSPSPNSPSRPPSTHTSQRPMSMSSRLSISSRDLPLASPTHTAGSSSTNSDEKGDKKSHRAGRMLRRMSSSLSAGRKAVSHAMSPTVREESEPPNSFESQFVSSQASTTMVAAIVEVGDVNVQFPDSLLWKRRSMAIDITGYLTLSPALTIGLNSKDKGSSATRRFHLSAFRLPAVPDVEMQELPNSVVLDFIEGGGLQIACQDRAGQDRVLKVLQDAHRMWAAYGQ